MKGVPIRKVFDRYSKKGHENSQILGEDKGKRCEGWRKIALAHQPFNFEEWEVCESLLVRKGGEFYLHVTVKKDVGLKKEYASIIAIDLGARWVACRWHGTAAHPNFMGRG